MKLLEVLQLISPKNCAAETNYPYGISPVVSEVLDARFLVSCVIYSLEQEFFFHILPRFLVKYSRCRLSIFKASSSLATENLKWSFTNPSLHLNE